MTTNYIYNFINSITTDNNILNTVLALSILEFFKGFAIELSSIIFKGDSINIPYIDINININRFMKYMFIFLFAILVISIYKSALSSTQAPIKGGNSKIHKISATENNKKKVVKFTKR